MSILTERRRVGWSGDLLFRVGLVWLLVCAILLVANWGNIAVRRLPDPDDMMRLLQVRDLLAGQSWFDVTQYRVDAPHGGVAMHWSRLVDIPLALVMLALQPLLGAAAAETVALIAVPLLSLGLAMLLAARIAWYVIGEEAAGLTCLVVALSVPLLFQFAPLRIDHHGWQVICALAAVNGMMHRSPVKGGWITGLSLAAWLAISVEGLPMALVVCSLLALRWLRRSEDRAWMVNTLRALALGSLAIFLATRGIGDLAQHCDAISPVHLLVFLWGAVALSVLAAPRRLPPAILFSGFALTAAGAVAILFAAAPHCTGGGFAGMDPVVREMWFLGIKEGLPIWHQSPAVILQNLFFPVLGLVAAIRLWGRSAAWLRDWWFDYALLLLAALAMAVLVARAGALACALAAVPLGWQLREWRRAIRMTRRPARRVAASAAALAALVPTLPLTLAGWAVPATASPASSQAFPRKASRCRVADAAPVLAKLPRGEFLAPLAISPALLLASTHTVVSTSHHRGQAGMRFVIDAFTAPVSEAHAAIATRGSRYLALCPGLMEVEIYRNANSDGLAARLAAGEPPRWLEPVAMPAGTQLKLWKIRR